jgi:hypothetical protein
MKKAPFIVLLIISSTTFAQKKLALKVYQNSDFFSTAYSDSYGKDLGTSNNAHFTRLSLAVNLIGKKFIHELELFVPEVDKSTDDVMFPMDYSFRQGTDFKTRMNAYSFRYELNKRLAVTSNKWSFQLGVGLNPYFVQQERIPTINTRYYYSLTTYGGSFNFIPRVAFNVSKRFTVDLNLPLKIYDLRYQRQYVANPNIPRQNQTTGGPAHRFFENAYTVRVGVMYNF